MYIIVMFIVTYIYHKTKIFNYVTKEQREYAE